jgi:hypothetical protein
MVGGRLIQRFVGLRLVKALELTIGLSPALMFLPLLKVHPSAAVFIKRRGDNAVEVD